MFSFRNAWLGLAVSLALHVTDEALTGFLPAYNQIVEGMKARHPWLPLPTFTFPVWLTGLIIGIILLFGLTPLAARNNRYLRIIALFLALLMIGNALAHLGASLYWGKAAPGVYSSPVLLAAAWSLLWVSLHPRPISGAPSKP